VLLSSHILAQVEALCDRVTIIRQGKDVESGTLEELRHLTRTSVTVETKQSADSLAELQGVHNFSAENGRVTFDIDTDRIDSAIKEVSALGIRNLISRPPTLEQLFMRHYGEELTDAERTSVDEEDAA
jgi:ABC-2 type transport system ATP-binding protein